MSSAALRLWRRRLQLATRLKATCTASSSSSSTIARAGFSTTAAVDATPLPSSLARTSSTPTPPAGRGDSLALLEKSIAQQAPTHALAYFDRLDQPPADPLVTQKLAVLVAKRGRRHEVPRAVEFLRGIFRQPELVASDYTKLAAIYVADACLRHRMLPLALDVYEEAHAVGVVLDLPAYDSLVEALVEADEVGKAVEILKTVSEAKDVEPTCKSYFPMLLAFMERCQYQNVTELIDYGRKRGVVFSLETYDPLVELGEIQGEDEDNLDGLEHFMDYVNMALEADGIMSDLEDIEIEFQDDDEDDDDDLDGDDLGDEDFDDDEFE